MKVTFFLVWSMTAVEVLWGRRRNPELDHAEEPEGWWSREELDDPWWSHRTPKGAEPTLRGAWHEDHHPLWHHHYYERRPPSKNNGDLTTAATLAALFIKLFLLKINSLGILKLVILGALFLIKIPLILGFKALILFKALKVAKAVALAPLLLLLLPLLPILLLLPLLLLFLLPVPVLTPPAAAAAGRRRRDLAYPQNQLDTMAKLMEAESCLRRIACHLDYDRSHVREYGLWYRQSKRSTNTVRENFSSSSERKRKQCARQFPCSYFNRPG